MSLINQKKSSGSSDSNDFITKKACKKEIDFYTFWQDLNDQNLKDSIGKYFPVVKHVKGDILVMKNFLNDSHEFKTAS